jgi:hypothetical protein
VLRCASGRMLLAIPLYRNDVRVWHMCACVCNCCESAPLRVTILTMRRSCLHTHAHTHTHLRCGKGCERSRLCLGRGHVQPQLQQSKNRSSGWATASDFLPRCLTRGCGRVSAVRKQAECQEPGPSLRRKSRARPRSVTARYFRSHPSLFLGE